MDIDQKLELISDKAGLPRHGGGIRSDLVAQLLGVNQRTLNRYRAGDFVPESVDRLIDLLVDSNKRKIQRLWKSLNLESLD